MDFLLCLMAAFLGLSLAEAERPSLRLEGGMSPCAGRVEVYHQQEWGTVCDDEWGMPEAQVVCRQLNCGTAVRAPTSAFFGQGLSSIWLANVKCKGTETSLQQCHHPAWGRHNCRHEEDAGVVCSAATTLLEEVFPSPAPLQKETSDVAVPSQTTAIYQDQDSVRLVGGTGHCSGRVEIFHGTEWGTVCDDDWDIRDAAVVCRQLGCGPAISANSRAKFGPGSGTIWLDDMHCSGAESSLAECKKMPWGSSNCKHDEDASVVCAEGKGVTLVNGPGRCVGRVEVYYDNNWGTICDDLWGMTNAHVVCKQLGCGTALSAPGSAFFGEGKGPIWLDNVNCTGQELSVLDCASQPWGKHNCRHKEDAGVVCSDELQETRAVERNNEPTAPEQRRTMVASTPNPEIQAKLSFPDRPPSEDSPAGQETEQWFHALPPPIVGELFDATSPPPLRPLEEPSPGPSVQETTSTVGQRSSAENETEVEVAEVPPSFPDTTDQSPEILRIRLTGGPNRCSGRVEVYHNQEWGTVCDDGWGILDAMVVCRQLGCGPVASFKNLYGPGSGPIWKDELACYGIESSLIQCNSQPWGYTDCKHREDAGVQCQDTIHVDEKLVNVTVLPPTQSHVHSYDVTMKETSSGPAGGTKPQNATRPHVECVCHTPMAACEPQQLPQLVKIMGEMKGDFSIITHLLQDNKHQLQSMASSMREVASSLRQMLEMFTVHLAQKSTGEV